MQKWNRCRAQVPRTWLIMALVVGGLLLAACTPATAPVTQPGTYWDRGRDVAGILRRDPSGQKTTDNGRGDSIARIYPATGR